MLTVFAWGLFGFWLLGALTSLLRTLRDRRLFERQSTLKTIRELSSLDFNISGSMTKRLLLFEHLIADNSHFSSVRNLIALYV